jgi:hypothetical protein
MASSRMTRWMTEVTRQGKVLEKERGDQEFYMSGEYVLEIKMTMETFSE